MSEFSQGDIYKADITNEFIEAMQKLTPREVEVLKSVASGCTSREIGKRLNISYRTVQKHRENVCKKLGLRGYRSLFKWCMKHVNGIDKKITLRR